MAEITFFARGDSGTANNPTLNVRPLSQVPTTALTFTSGETGDIQLDFNDGLPDPDTQVIINGTAYSFTVVLTGTLPLDNALSNLAGFDVRGERVIIIEAAGQRWFLLPDSGLTLEGMTAFPNGARSLSNVITGGDPVIICFTAGTMILTPEGERAVETLRAGDRVVTGTSTTSVLLWVGHTHLSVEDLARHQRLRPIRIPQGMFGASIPSRPLEVSPQHRILLKGWPVELSTGAEAGLIPARQLVEHGAIETAGTAPVDYFHLLFESHEIVFANGLATESLQPNERNLQRISPAAKAEFDMLFPDGIPEWLSERPLAAPALRSNETRLVIRAFAGA